ncbi:MAG: bile acid:sodium symporter family protein [Verrucomicrobiota bacterium]
MPWLKRIGLDGFVLALIGVIALAWAFPGLAAKDSPVPLSFLTDLGITSIFFFYGIKLSPEKMRAGFANWRLHLVVHSATFILFPLLVLAAIVLLRGKVDHAWLLGVFYVAALPSTVSSSVVMVSIAKGNVAGAIFDASLSSILGVFLTPIWMSVFLAGSQADFDLWHTIQKIMIQVLAPIIIGQIFHRRLVHWAERHKNGMQRTDQSIVLLIVYSSFARAFLEGVFKHHGLFAVLILMVAMLILFGVVFAIINLICRLLHFSREDRIAALFCGSKKSLVAGAPMAKILFPDPAVQSLAMLPLVIYHSLQLIAGSIIARRFSQQTNT